MRPQKSAVISEGVWRMSFIADHGRIGAGNNRNRNRDRYRHRKDMSLGHEKAPFFASLIPRECEFQALWLYPLQ
jgi:hypothetical protein